MATLKDSKTIGPPFRYTSELIRVTYDFANDGGIATAKDVLIADTAFIIKSFYFVVKTTCVGASGTLDIGVSGGATTVLAPAVPVASLVAGFVYAPAPVTTIVLGEGTPNTITSVTHALPFPLYIATSGKIVMETNTTAFTAGKIELVFEITQP
jgi:hypothetical protein